MCKTLDPSRRKRREYGEVGEYPSREEFDLIRYRNNKLLVSELKGVW